MHRQNRDGNDRQHASTRTPDPQSDQHADGNRDGNDYQYDFTNRYRNPQSDQYGNQYCRGEIDGYPDQYQRCSRYAAVGELPPRVRARVPIHRQRPIPASRDGCPHRYADSNKHWRLC